jgi:hypothetical protein
MSHNLSLMNQKAIRKGDQDLSFCMKAEVRMVDMTLPLQMSTVGLRCKL